MRVIHSATLLPPNQSDKNVLKSIRAICWSNDCQKAAVCRPDNIIQLYDAKGCARDKFHTRPRDTKENANGYQVTSMSFSPDGCSLAVGQSDGIVFIYKIGDFKEKKSISNKFPQPCPVTTLEWPNDSQLFIGLLDGKIRVSHNPDRKSNKVTLAHSGDSPVIRLIGNSIGTELAASFMDGKVLLFSIGEMEQTLLKVSIRHARPATALCIGPEALVAGGSDQKLIIYEKKAGKVKQIFDYSKTGNRHLDMTWAAMSTAGNAFITASSNKLKVYLLNSRTKKWEEGKEKPCPQIFNPTCFALRRDGSYLTVGTCAGSCEMFELVYKRTKSQKIDVNYISPSHVVVTIYTTNQKAVLKSKYHNEIIDVKLMGKDRYVIAKTTETMFVADLEDDLTSEVPWPETEDSERFYFSPSVCMIFNHGELSLLEYGRDEILGTYRTSVINPHVISVRINERISSHQMVEGSQNKRMAYLLDYKTIQIVDLEFVLTLGSISHEHKIDWLELNETGTKLLFRDRRMILTLVDVNTMEKFILDRSCGFVQWVPGCDVIVCQSEKQLRIWYNMDAPEISVDQDVQGIATEIVRENEQSVVMMKEGSKFVPIPLDENRIQFSAALELGNLARATYFLEESRSGPDMPSMWVKLGKTAALHCEPRIALRAFAAVDDVPKTRFLDALIKRNSSKGGKMYDEKKFWKSDYWTKANMHLLVGDVKQAVTILFENDDVDAAIELYSSLHEFDTVIDLIKTKHHPNEGSIVQDFVTEWYNTEQYDLLGDMAERIGKSEIAICFFLEAGYPNRAAPYALQNPATLRNTELVRALTESLVEKNFVEDAGNIYEATGQHSKALECFRRGKFFDKAVNLARSHFQYEVVPLEEEWGDHLMFLKQYDAASNHFIEAGNTLKALEAIIEARQFKKAAQIIETLDATETVGKYYLKIGEYFKDIKNYSQAEKCFIRGGTPKKAIDMYTEIERWGDAYRTASEFNESRDELHRHYLEQAKSFQAEGRLDSAEKVLLAIEEVDLAISMYAKAKRYDDVLRLVEEHHPEHTNDTMIHLAEVLLGEENYKGAEMQFIKANHWDRAVEMYEGRKMWEDAVRVARSHGGVNAFRQVVFRWSRSLPVDSAVKLLSKYSYLDDCITFNCQQGDFQMAEGLAEVAAPEKLPEVHLAWAQFLEQRNNFLEAKTHYLKANKPRLAIDMLISANEIQEAIVTADKYAKDELPRVLVMYAKVLFAQKEFTTFESVMLRAEKIVQAIDMYKSNNMWAEALKLCKQYVPTMYNQLNEEYTMYRSVSETVTNEPMEIVQQARELERQGDYQRAIDRYLQLTPANLNDDTVLCKCWVRAAELAKKFLPKSQSMYLMKGVAPMLDGIKCYSEAATMYLQVNMYKEALNSMVMGELWTEAMRLAREMGPENEDYVRQKQAETFRSTGKMDRLDDLGMDAQLDLLCEKNMWKQCLERAKSNNELFAKYLAKYVTHIVKTRSPQDALEVYASEYGPLIHKLHLNLYRAIASLIINDMEQDEFDTWSKFRDVMFTVCYGLRSAGLDPSSKTFILMESYLWVMHLLATKSAFKTFPGLEQLAAKISMSLLRFIKIVNPERAFYEAGSLCKQVKWESNAFVFFNYYMDIHDAVVAGIRSTADLDQSDLIRTDVPKDVDLHSKIIVPAAWHDKVKEWVLAISMDSSVTQELTTDERGVFEGSLQEGDGKVYEACVLTGFPVLSNRVTFRTTKKYANKDDWNRFLITCRGEHNDPRLDNILQFIEKWAGPYPSYN